MLLFKFRDDLCWTNLNNLRLLLAIAFILLSFAFPFSSFFSAILFLLFVLLAVVFVGFFALFLGRLGFEPVVELLYVCWRFAHVELALFVDPFAAFFEHLLHDIGALVAFDFFHDRVAGVVVISKMTHAYFSSLFHC